MKSYTVLVIEDEELLLNAIVKKLKLNGLSVIPTTSGTEALKILEEAKKLPDAIWLDYYLNDMNGLDFMNTLRKNDKFTHIPTIVVSNSASDDKVNNMLGLGVKKYYLKAENRLDEIIAYVREFVKKEGNEKT
jgi:CheY-like chemotaxis protein